MTRRPNLADEMLARMYDGRAHDDAMLMLTSCVEQVRAQQDGRPWPADLWLEQATVLVGDAGTDYSVEDFARVIAMTLDLASLSATILAALSDATDLDLDGLLAGMAQVRPPFGP